MRLETETRDGSSDFETSGAASPQLGKLLKQLSEIASSRRGHHKETFYKTWQAAIAFTLAKRGAEVALRRCHMVVAEQRQGRPSASEADGRLGHEDAEPLIHYDLEGGSNSRSWSLGDDGRFCYGMG